MKKAVQKVKINISSSSAFKIFLVGLALIFIYFAKAVLINIAALVFISAIFAAAFHGPVSWLEKRHIPRLLGTAFVYIILFFIIALIVYLIFPPLANEVWNLATNFPSYIEKIGGGIEFLVAKYQLQDQVQSILVEVGYRLQSYASGLFAAVISFFGGLISALALIFISFYLTLNSKEVKRFIISLVRPKHKEYTDGLIDRFQIKMGNWLRGQLFLMFIVGLLIFIGLSILQVKYALILALVAGLLEIIPWLGPWVSGIIATILTFVQAPFLALFVIILFLAVQQLENHLIVPLVMNRAVGLNPVVVIVVLLMGGKLAGVFGAAIAVPLAAVLHELVKDYQRAINKTQ